MPIPQFTYIISTIDKGKIDIRKTEAITTNKKLKQNHQITFLEIIAKEQKKQKRKEKKKSTEKIG